MVFQYTVTGVNTVIVTSIGALNQGVHSIVLTGLRGVTLETISNGQVLTPQAGNLYGDGNSVQSWNDFRASMVKRQGYISELRRAQTFTRKELAILKQKSQLNIVANNYEKLTRELQYDMLSVALTGQSGVASLVTKQGGDSSETLYSGGILNILEDEGVTVADANPTNLVQVLESVAIATEQTNYASRVLIGQRKFFNALANAYKSEKVRFSTSDQEVKTGITTLHIADLPPIKFMTVQNFANPAFMTSYYANKLYCVDIDKVHPHYFGGMPMIETFQTLTQEQGGNSDMHQKTISAQIGMTMDTVQGSFILNCEGF